MGKIDVILLKIDVILLKINKNCLVEEKYFLRILNFKKIFIAYSYLIYYYWLLLLILFLIIKNQFIYINANT